MLDILDNDIFEELVDNITTYVSPDLPTNIVDFRGFDSSTILNLRGGISRPKRDFLESSSQAMLVGCNVSGEIWRTTYDIRYMIHTTCYMTHDMTCVCNIYIYIYIYIYYYYYYYYYYCYCYNDSSIISVCTIHIYIYIYTISLSLSTYVYSMCIYIYIHTYFSLCVYIYIYIHTSYVFQSHQ